MRIDTSREKLEAIGRLIDQWRAPAPPEGWPEGEVPDSDVVVWIGAIAGFDHAIEAIVAERDRLRLDVKMLRDKLDWLQRRYESSQDASVRDSVEINALRARVAEVERGLVLRKRDTWQDDDRDVVWWALPIQEPPYVGTPNDDDFPEYVTHWTPLICPDESACLRAEEESDNG